MADISADFPFAKRRLEVEGVSMAFVEEGEGDPIVLLHGNPTSSYLWRNVIPHLSGLGRCIVPDLVGMGDSAKLDPALGADRYSFFNHARFLDAFLEAVGATDRVALVLHDWGSGLGFHWANRHRRRVRGIAYMEAIVMPLTWEDWPEAARGIFKGFRTPGKGEELILERNMFIEGVLPSSVQRGLSDAELDHYRAPFVAGGEDRLPMLAWPRAIPIAGEPGDVVQMVVDYGAWLAESSVPKLFINAEPGSILTGRARKFCRGWRNQTEVTLPGLHFIQEDSPAPVGRAVADFLRAN